MESEQQVSLQSVLEYFTKQKFTSVLVEGGQQIFSQFIHAGLWDELKIFIAPKILGTGLKAFSLIEKQRPSTFHLHDATMVDEDVLLTFLADRSHQT